ncbi:hypothetical protein TRFO_20936 [Tritrichomonas foetus]|uniref:Lecithin:cholesterol acyltransferase family protein n=1 Tax=Tritrichomonas foetus TaxID=1144522 RepID=A0A1J4KJL9_9EUKA|nr:hypothetical protein TRFO_20936 [Tritrichomonas foetus]|eukprot:OHT10020.1 hypothetical protein TRFO_20936 [Tritrichomonas foetus]
MNLKNIVHRICIQLFVMIFLFFIPFLTARKPVILVPGFTGSAVYATITKPDLYPQCPNIPVHFQFYPYNQTFLKQYPDCVGLFMTTYFNNESKKVESLPGIKIETAPYGDVDTLPSYSGVVERLLSEGYELNKTLFGFPYNWILYYSGIPEIFEDLKNRIEEATEQTGEKLILFGHSMGSHVVRMLINNHVDQNWVQKHIDRIVYNAPAFYGCSDLIRNVLTGTLEDDNYYEGLAKAIRQMPSVFLLFENYNIIKDKPVFYNKINQAQLYAENINNKFTSMKDNENTIVNPRNVVEFLHERGFLNEESLRVFETVESSLKDDKIVEPPVPTILFYNSGLPTPVYFNSTTYEIIKGEGDGFCQSDILDVVCGKWKNTKCIDWKKNDENFGHIPMLKSKEELDMIIDFFEQKNKEL